MPEFHSLPGVKGGRLEGPYVNSVSGFLAALRNNRAASDAGDFGAVMVWIDDDGAYRAAFMQHCSIVSETTVSSKASLREWLKEWMPKQHVAERNAHDRDGAWP